MGSKFEVYVNQAGYPVKGEKYALAPRNFESFEIVDKDNKVVYSGNAVNLGEDINSGDNVYAAIFLILNPMLLFLLLHNLPLEVLSYHQRVQYMLLHQRYWSSRVPS